MHRRSARSPDCMVIERGRPAASLQLAWLGTPCEHTPHAPCFAESIQVTTRTSTLLLACWLNAGCCCRQPYDASRFCIAWLCVDASMRQINQIMEPDQSIHIPHVCLLFGRSARTTSISESQRVDRCDRDRSSCCPLVCHCLPVPLPLWIGWPQ